MGGMKRIMEKAYLFGVVVVARIILASCLPITVPAFVWSDHHQGSFGYDKQGSVIYHVISPRSLARNVLNTAGWAQLLCSGEKGDLSADTAVVFIGSKLHSLDISRNRRADSESDLIELLKTSFAESNFSMAFPYVALSKDGESLATSLLSGFMENCKHGFRISEVAFMEPCFLEGPSFKKLGDLKAVNDYVNSRKETRMKGATDLIFMCSHKSSVFEAYGRTPEEEGKHLAEILMNLKQTQTTYTFLYTSDPYEMLPYPRFEKLERHLISDVFGNSSSNFTYCDGVCKTKASLLEGLLIGLVLLIILLSGLCCMMGIETPTRFETPQES